MTRNPTLTLTIGQFKKRFLSGELLDAKAIDGQIYFANRQGRTGFVAQTNGQPKVWNRYESAAGIVEELDLRRFLKA